MKSAFDKSKGGATFFVACGVLAMMALAQIGLSLWGWQKRLEAKELAIKVKVVPPVESLPKPKVIPATPIEAPVVAKQPTLPPVRIASPQKVVPPSLDVPITDERILNFLEEGLVARKKNDMQGAVTAFRSAWQLLPDHPKLIYQLAHTLDLMSLESRAQQHWNTLINLGHAAGDYYELAEMRLKNKGMLTPGPAESEEKEGRLQLTDVRIENVPGVRTTEKKRLSFTLKKAKQEKIESGDIALAIHFFDLKNGRALDRTTAAVPSPVIVSTVEDWEKNGVERYEVVYDQAEMTPADVMKFGQRKYYGYVLEVYLKDSQRADSMDRLQDLVAEPPELANFAREMPVESAEPKLLPSNAADASLFPR